MRMHNEQQLTWPGFVYRYDATYDPAALRAETERLYALARNEGREVLSEIGPRGWTLGGSGYLCPLHREGGTVGVRDPAPVRGMVKS